MSNLLAMPGMGGISASGAVNSRASLRDQGQGGGKGRIRIKITGVEDSAVRRGFEGRIRPAGVALIARGNVFQDLVKSSPPRQAR
jgi:hypothetical protein